jgi:hypothetical protein
MIYPMVQSVALACVEKFKKMTPQWHCPLSIVVIMKKQNHSYTKIGMRHGRSPRVQRQKNMSHQ